MTNAINVASLVTKPSNAEVKKIMARLIIIIKLITIIINLKEHAISAEIPVIKKSNAGPRMVDQTIQLIGMIRRIAWSTILSPALRFFMTMLSAAIACSFKFIIIVISFIIIINLAIVLFTSVCDGLVTKLAPFIASAFEFTTGNEDFVVVILVVLSSSSLLNFLLLLIVSKFSDSFSLNVSSVSGSIVASSLSSMFSTTLSYILDTLFRTCIIM